MNSLLYILIYKFGVLGFWGFGVLGFWGFGVLGFWGFGVMGESEESDIFLRMRTLDNPPPPSSLSKTLTNNNYRTTPNLEKLIYSSIEEYKPTNNLDSSKFIPKHLLTVEEYVLIIKSKFVTGGDYEEDYHDIEEGISEEESDSEGDEEANSSKLKHKKPKGIIEFSEDENMEGKEEISILDRRKYMKRRDGFYEMGEYIRVDLYIDDKYISLLNPYFPIILCAFDQAEQTLGFLRVRIKKHRWYPKILKSHDPLIFSFGILYIYIYI